MNKLTDYQVKSAFQDVLSGLYKKKIRELNDDLSEVYAHLDKLDVPRYTDFDRWFARQCLPNWAKAHFKTIEHINRIRRIKLNDCDKETLDIQKARQVPIETLYEFKRKGKNVSCPFHVDNSPSASIKYNRLVCFSCGFKGDGISLVMRLNNLKFVDAVKYLTRNI